MTVYNPMTPKMRNQIDDAYRKKVAELDGCENNSGVQLLRTIYRMQRDILMNLPDGYLIPFTDERR